MPEKVPIPTLDFYTPKEDEREIFWLIFSPLSFYFLRKRAIFMMGDVKNVARIRKVKIPSLRCNKGR